MIGYRTEKECNVYQKNDHQGLNLCFYMLWVLYQKVSQNHTNQGSNNCLSHKCSLNVLV